MRFLEFKGYQFRIKKITNEHLVSNAKDIRSRVNADLTLRRGDKLFFVEYVPEADVVEYIENTSIKNI